MIDTKMKKVVQITITERCNLNCVYCYEKRRNHNIMEIELAKSIISKSFKEYKDADFIEFDFHGGEIILAFDLISAVCNWTWGQKWDKEYIFHATTNGTLIHGHIQEWFRINKDRFNLGLSLDGNKIMHDLNRSNSYDMIDMDFFFETYPNQPVKMTISPMSLPSLFDGIMDIYNRGFDVSANLAYGMDWDNHLLKRIYQEQLSKLVNWYIDHPSKNVCNLLSDRGFKYIGKCVSDKTHQIHRKWCGTKDNMKCYSVEGNVSPCQFFNPSSNSNYSKEDLLLLDFSNIGIDEECANCPILSICPTCYGANYSVRKELNKRPDVMCDYRKIESLASSYLYGIMFISDEEYTEVHNYSEIEKAYCMLGIKYIQDNVSIIFDQ